MARPGKNDDESRGPFLEVITIPQIIGTELYKHGTMIMWTISLFSKQTAKSLDNTYMDYNLLNEFIRFDNNKKSYKKES